MELFFGFRFSKAVYLCHSSFQKLADQLRSREDAQHNAVAKQFTDAVDRYDCDTVNRMLEEAMAHYLHTTDLVTGMKEYCSKFGIDMDIFHMGEDDRIFFIADHKDEIERILSAHGV